MSAKELLLSINACPEAIRFADGKTIKQAWETCNRGDWMLWFYSKQFPNDIRKITLAKAYCANTVCHLMNDERSKHAVDVAIKFGYGFATSDELKLAADAAADAADAAAAADAADAAAYAAKKQNELLTANICRQFLDISSLYDIGE